MVAPRTAQTLPNLALPVNHPGGFDFRRRRLHPLRVVPRLAAVIACLLLPACGNTGNPDPSDGDASDPADAADGGDPADTDPDPDPDPDLDADTSADPIVDPGEEDTRPPLGPCGAYCMGESRSCPDGAICEYGVLDITFLCTDEGCGLCAWIPDTCPPDDDPACGCDGVVYANPCERRRARAQPDIAWTHCEIPDM